MYSSSREKYFHIVLGFSLFFLMLNVPPASSFPQNQGANKPSAVENGSGVTMKQVSGKVVETMNSGGYTYVLVEGSDATTLLRQADIAMYDAKQVRNCYKFYDIEAVPDSGVDPVAK